MAGVLAIAAIVYATRTPATVPVEKELPAGLVPAVSPGVAVVAPVVKPALPPEVIPQVELQVTGQPEKLEVYEGEKLLGQTQLTIRRDKGAQVKLRFAQGGFVEQVQPVFFRGR